MTYTTVLGLPLYAAGENGENWCKGINFSGNQNNAFSKIDAYAQNVNNQISKIKGSTGTVVLAAANWVSGTYTLSVTGLGADDDIAFAPSSRTDMNNAAASGLFITPSHSGGTVTITAETTPSVDISLDYSIRGR